MPIFSGRIEARLTIPTGGAAVSASNSGGGATTVTVPAGSFYLTAAGGVTGLVAAFQSQLNTSRAPSSGSWTVALGSDGRVSIGCTGTTAIPSFSLDWTSTVLRDVLGFQYSINYPTDATELARQIGFGTWTSGAGWLCNEASGNLVPAFGSPTLTATSLTYGTAGPRGGADKAIGFDANSDNADGGNVFDVIATEDLIVAWVGYLTAVPAGSVGLFSKYTTNGWSIQFDAGGNLNFDAFNGGVRDFRATLVAATGGWYVGIAVIDRSTGKARIGIRTLAGVTTVATEQTANALSYTTAGTFRIGQRSDGTLNASTGSLVAAVYVVDGVGVATGLSANLSTALSNFAAQFGTITGTEQAEGLLYLDAPLTCDDHPSMAPRMSDLRTSQSPTGVVLGLSGNTYFKHTNLSYQRVPVERIREASATYANASLEVFWEHTQLGLGPSWFSVSSPVQVYWSNAGVETLLGADETIAGWTITGAGAVKDIARPSQRNWVGQWDVTFPALIASGS